MAFSTLSFKRPDPIGKLIRGLVALLVCLSLWQGPAARAEGVVIKAAEVTLQDGGLTLNANYDIALGHVLEDALTRGVPLIFFTEFELEYPRWYFLNLWNKSIATYRNEQRLTYNILTRQYRLSVGALHQNFESLGEALAVMGRVRDRMVHLEDSVLPGTVYIAGIRMGLDTSQLPKPLQINAIGSRDWNIGSEWYRWTFKP